MHFTWICVMAATVAVNTIFVLSLLANLSWGQRAVFIFAAAVLAAGLIFTIRTLQRLARPE